MPGKSPSVGAAPPPRRNRKARRGEARADEGRGPGDEGGLVASGMFVINPPFTLKDQIRKALDVVGPALARGSGKDWKVEASS